MSSVTSTTLTLVAPAVSPQDMNVRMVNGIPVPIEFFDPITWEIMTDPMIVFPSGRTYDQSTIEQIKETNGPPTDPISNQAIISTVENRALKDTIERFLKLHPSLRPSDTQRNSQAPTRSVEAVADNVSSYTEDQFMSLFLDKDEVTFPANRKIVIYNVSRSLIFKVCNNPSIKNIFSILDNILLPLAKMFNSISIEGHFAISAKLSERFISFKPTTELTVNLHKNGLVTNIKLLFERLSRSNIEILNVKPNQWLAIELSSQEKDYILEDENEKLSRIHDVFLSHLPEEFDSVNINLNGRDVQIKRTLNDDDGTVFNGIAIACDQGFSIKLKKKAQPPA